MVLPFTPAHAHPLPIKPVDAPLYVVTSITNPARFKSRYHLYRQFEKYIKDSGAILYTIEGGLREREYEITDPSDPQHIRVNTTHELWHKENLLNLAIQRLPPDWKYVAWIDADIEFARPDWVYECLHKLQHFHVVQMFSQAADLDSKFRILPPTRDSFVYWYYQNRESPVLHKRYAARSHPGYAWAWRRDAIDGVGGLIDWAVVGSGDFHMACALLGQVEKSFAPIKRTCPNYLKWCIEWQNRAEVHINRNIGYMDGLLLHYWHGPKAKRGYYDRWKILSENRFDPNADIKRDWQGMWQLNGADKIDLRDQLRGYLASRDEDSTS
jgi:hypothetical protein